MTHGSIRWLNVPKMWRRWQVYERQHQIKSPFTKNLRTDDIRGNVLSYFLVHNILSSLTNQPLELSPSQEANSHSATRRFITLFTRALLSRDRRIQSIPLHPISIRPIFYIILPPTSRSSYSSSRLSKYIKIKIYNNNFIHFYVGVKLFFHPKERVFGNKVVRKIFVPKRGSDRRII
jgi:hypothetical protein